MPAADKANPSAIRNATQFQLRQALKLALSMVLFYWLALSFNWDEPKYGGLAIVIVSLATTGASIQTGVLRIVGTVVGVAVGFLVLGLFSHDRWMTLLVFAGYLTAMGYFMQTSRYPYSWYAAAFIPLVVWADTYPNFQSAFYFGTFRFLTTTVGVLIYTTLDLILWPHHAADQLDSLGRDLWIDIRQQFSSSRERLRGDGSVPGDGDQRPSVAEDAHRTAAAVQDAYFDSAEVRRQRRAWEVWRVHLWGLLGALRSWQESVEECRDVDLDQCLPGLGDALDVLDKRFVRMAALWEQKSADRDLSQHEDEVLMEPLTTELDLRDRAELTDFERAALTEFVRRLKTVDQEGRELLRIMRVLAGIDAGESLVAASHVQGVVEHSHWDRGRLIRALYPTASYIAAFLLWVLINPPGGPKVAMFAALLALIILRTPMNPLPLWILMFLSTIFVVAPIYWLVMPALSTGLGLLALIFVYSFVFAYLGGRSPALKSGPIIMFVVLTGISNQQSFSFQSVAVGSQMILIAGIVMTVVYFLFETPATKAEPAA